MVWQDWLAIMELAWTQQIPWGLFLEGQDALPGEIPTHEATR